MTIVLAGGHGVALTTLGGLPQSDLFSREQERVRNIMKRFKIHLLLCVVATMLIPLLLTTAVAQAQPAPWTVVPSPSPGALGNELNGVASVSAKDVWAVGSFVVQGFGPAQTLTLHWNGTSWSVVSSPNASTGFNSLAAAAMVSANDVWAVGRFLSATGVGQTLIEQWNGTSWSVVASPNVGTDNGLKGVAIVSATDIWAVGFTITNGVNQTLIEQWNGTSWSVVKSPNPSASFNTLNGAAADKSSGQAWAVGDFSNASQHLQTLTEFNP